MKGGWGSNALYVGNLFKPVHESREMIGLLFFSFWEKEGTSEKVSATQWHSIAHCFQTFFQAAFDRWAKDDPIILFTN